MLIVNIEKKLPVSQEKKDIIFVVGSPRSGTTFLASEICKRIDTPLMPEAQWIIESVKNKTTEDYTSENWSAYKVYDTQSDISAHLIDKIFIEECDIRNVTMGDTIVEHTPQNILILDKIRKIYAVSSTTSIRFIAPLRDPSKSIQSLIEQEWFNKGVVNAAFFNFRCMFNLFKFREKIDFIKIDNENVQSLLDCKFGSIPKKFEYYSNSIQNSPKLINSHKYFLKKTQKTNVSFLVIFLSIPSQIIYRYLLRWI